MWANISNSTLVCMGTLRFALFCACASTALTTFLVCPLTYKHKIYNDFEVYSATVTQTGITMQFHYPLSLTLLYFKLTCDCLLQVQQALNQLVVMPLSNPALMQLTTFNCSVSSCYDPNEELRLRHVIDAIGTERFELKIRQLGQLILDRELSSSRGLLVDAVLADGTDGTGTATMATATGAANTACASESSSQGDVPNVPLPPDPSPAIPDVPVASVSVKISDGSTVNFDEDLIIEI